MRTGLCAQEFHGEKELFTSDHNDYILKSTVLTRCQVYTLQRYQELAVVAEHDYYSRFMYKVGARACWGGALAALGARRRPQQEGCLARLAGQQQGGTE